jgi:hypothetical protein
MAVIDAIRTCWNDFLKKSWRKEASRSSGKDKVMGCNLKFSFIEERVTIARCSIPAKSS